MRPLLFVCIAIPLALASCAPPHARGDRWYVVQQTVHEDGRWRSASFIAFGRIQYLDQGRRRAWVDQYSDEWDQIGVLSLIEFDCRRGTLQTLETTQYDTDGEVVASSEMQGIDFVVPGSRADVWRTFVCEQPSAWPRYGYEPLDPGVTPALYMERVRHGGT